MAEEKEYNLVHEKRKGSKGKGGKSNGKTQQPQHGADVFHSQFHSNADQRNGNFSFDTVHGLPLKEVEYTVPPKEERKAKRAEFGGVVDYSTGTIVQEGVRMKFLKMLANEHDGELREKLGLEDKEIESMKKGYCPLGYNVHHKLPLHGGGKNEFKNFILTPLYPHDQWHHDILDAQIDGMKVGETRKVMLPICDDMIYDPKKYGFTRNNEPVKPNYTSNVDPANYPKIYKAEHITKTNRDKELDALRAAAAARRQQGR
ncbi:MAG: hypothetical protein MJ247_00285 [Alphaproteobacteria bacterium]|nr:hypothetical protein [Alphaproteobacteria bacterium]